MASRHPRIQIPGDPEVQRAIERGRALVGPGAATSQVLRALALRGAAALDEDEEAQARGRDFLVSVAEGSSGIDLEQLRTVRDRAWR